MGAHDALFKHVFSVPEHAAAELAHVLPPEISARIAWSTLRLVPGSFVDPELAERHTDLLFSASLDGAPVYLYLLYEHQSSPHAWMPLRMAGYSVRILEAHRARHGTDPRLPLVLPVVLHHGEAPWAEARSLRDLYSADEATLRAVGPRTLAVEIVVDDLAATPVTAIVSRTAPAIVRLVLGVLRDVRSLSVDHLLARWRDLLVEVAREASGVVLRYVLEVYRIQDPRLLLDAARAQGGAELEEVAMNAIDRLKAEGKAEGKAELVLRQIRLKLGSAAADAVAGRVRAATEDDLDRYADRILDAVTIDDVLA